MTDLDLVLGFVLGWFACFACFFAVRR